MTAGAQLVIILSLWLGSVRAEADPKDGPNKPSPHNSFNSIQLSSQKPEIFSYQQLSQLGKYLPQQLYPSDVRTQYLQPSAPYQETPKRLPHHQVPVAMVIIAQPAYVPASALQPNNIAQLLQYFRGNPAARFQMLHGNFGQPQQQQQYVPTMVTPSAVPTQQYYQYHQPTQYQPTTQYQQTNQYQSVVPNAAVSYQNQEQPQGRSMFHQSDQQQVIPQKVNTLQYSQPPPSQPPFGQKLYPVIPHRLPQVPQQPQEVMYEHPQQNSIEQTQTEAPYQLGHISQIAQQAAEKFLMNAKDLSNQQGASSQQPYRTAPAIFTGFENFSPEQQAKIKAQLSAHFGAPLQPIKVADSDKSSENRGSSEEKA